MVFFFIAELALSLAIKATTWCLGKTYDGITYLVSRRVKTSDDDDSDEFVVISSEDYRALRRKHATTKPKTINSIDAIDPSPTQEESVSVSVSVSVPDTCSSSSASSK